jgi:alpha-methylacyl-CoA racemase
VYQTKDEKYMSVGALEPQFYKKLIIGLGLTDQADVPEQLDSSQWDKLRSIFETTFKSKTRDQWTEVCSYYNEFVTSSYCY